MTSNYLDTYYKILGISVTATIDQIKRAYRSKAKELHPDKNKSPDAHEQFILLTEAYECLINLNGGKTKTKRQSISYEEWQRQKREQARQRARQYSQMRYEEFKKSDYYKKSQAAFIIFDHFYLISSILIIFGAPILGFILNEGAGLIMGVVFVILSVHYWAGIFTEKININFKALGKSLIIIGKTKTLYYILITIINAILFFRFSLNTQLSSLIFLLLILSLYILAYFSFMVFSILKSQSKTLLFLCIIPSIFNLFFLTNFLLSSNQTIESYSFVHEKQWYGGWRWGWGTRSKLEKIGYIHLENKTYEEYHWFRCFFDFESMENANRITYRFEDGLCGLRVLKSYEFN